MTVDTKEGFTMTHMHRYAVSFGDYPAMRYATMEQARKAARRECVDGDASIIDTVTGLTLHVERARPPV